jgi:endoglucanase
MSSRHNEPAIRDLITLTSIPTAAGHEGRVIRWVERWASRRRQIELEHDRHGNLVLKHVDRNSRSPIFFSGHLDHPAFVVREIHNHAVTAEFRGGVDLAYFKNTRVQLWHGSKPSQKGRIVEVTQPAGEPYKRCRIEFKKSLDAEPGDILTWDLPESKIKSGRLHAPACDDLAAVAAAFAAFGQLMKGGADGPDVRLLLTRAEEVGFIGAIGACKASSIPKRAKVIALENSKSFSESPIGGGPIVRVGDRTSTFDPELTYAVSQVAESLSKHDPAFNWQRKLMPGGTCEASAYQSFGHTATCICLPLGNYHNMDESTGRISPEIISIDDYRDLIRLLIALGQGLNDADENPPLRQRLDKLFADRRTILSD